METALIIIGLCFWGCLFLLFQAMLAPAAKTVSVAERVKKVHRGAVVRDEEELNRSFFERVLVPMSDSFAKVFGKYTPASITQDSAKLLAEAGLTNFLSGAQLAGFSWILCLSIPTLIWVAYLASPISFAYKLTFVLLGAMIGLRLPSIMLRIRAKKRKDQIVKALPFAYDLLGISVEAGMGFDGAMAAVTERSRGPLSDEFSRTLTEIRLGKPRNQALVDLGERTGVEDLRSFVAAVSFISDLGGSLTDVLRVQAEAMRVKRRQRAEEKAMKAPVKMMIPLVFFIVPALFVVILGPAIILIRDNIINQ
ncbi:MAG: type II secretion system F family protein [Verrucomicrobiae bacterium]|nr:type II secretion system F family protein [Verrucomicrobiae bacterium]